MNMFAEDKGARVLLKAALASLALFLLALFFVKAKEFYYVGQDIYPQSTITVSGTAERFVIPDTGTFTFSVIEEGEDFASAQEAATLAINDVIAYLEEAGVDRDDIKTVNYSINPRYDYRTEAVTLSLSSYYPPTNTTRELAGYEVNQTVSVKTTDIDGIGELVTGVGQLGVSQVSSVSFTVEDEDSVRKDIRQEAIADARNEAKRIASSLGVRLGRVITYYDQGYNPYYRDFGYGGDVAYATSEAKVVSVDIPAGENHFSSTVQVTYELR